MSEEKPENITVEGEVFDKEERKRTRIGGSHHVTIPAPWKRFFSVPVLEVKLVLDEKLGWIILINKPQKNEEGDDAGK